MGICIIFGILIIMALPEIIEYCFNLDMSMYCVKTFHLVKLNTRTQANDFEQRYYVKLDGNKAVWALFESKNYIKKYKERKVKGKIQVHEQDESSDPMLKIFQNLPAFNLGVFTSVIAKTEYHFYIPKGMVLNVERK